MAPASRRHAHGHQRCNRRHRRSWQDRRHLRPHRPPRDEGHQGHLHRQRKEDLREVINPSSAPNQAAPRHSARRLFRASAPRQGRGETADATPCALYGKQLKRTPTFVRLLARFSPVHAALRPKHPMDFHFHPMDSPIHPMEISIQGHFSEENWGRNVPYSGEKPIFGRLCGGAFDGCV